MLNEQVIKALTFQMQHEKNNQYIYRLFAGIADSQSLLGTVNWMMKQSAEEESHFELIASYIQDQGHIPHLLAIQELPPQTLSLYDMFVRALELERSTTLSLKGVAQICKETNDDQTYNLILRMLTEQVQEEKSVGDILNRINLVGSSLGFLLVDQELAKR